MRVAIIFLALVGAHASAAGTRVESQLHPHSLRHQPLSRHRVHGKVHKQVLPEVSVAVAQRDAPAKNSSILVPSLPAQPLVPFAAPEQQHAGDAVEQSNNHTDARTAAVQLQQDFAEVTQNRRNVQQLQQALAVDQSLVHESQVHVKVSLTHAGRQAAKHQLQKSQELLTNTLKLVHDGREAAIGVAHDMVNEAEAVQKAADALSDEAQNQIRLFGSNQDPVISTDKSDDASVSRVDGFENATSQSDQDED